MIEFNFNEYQEASRRFDRSPKTMWYYGLGLAGEAGEVADKIKKSFRIGATPLNHPALALELGDVLWYLSALAEKIGYPLSTIARLNMEKLTRREIDGTLVGEGDSR